MVSSSLDVLTLVVVLGIGHLLLFVVLGLQFAVNRAYPGVGWWLLWAGSTAVGSALLAVRNVPFLRLASVVCVLPFMLLGMVFLYVGLMRFHGARERRALVSLLVGSFLPVHLAAVLVVDSFRVRSAAFAFVVAALSLLAARDLFRVRHVATRVPANLVCGVLSAHGLFALFRGVMISSGAGSVAVFDTGAFNVSPYVEMLVVGTLLTYGVVVLVNQRAFAEMVEARDRFQLLFRTSPDAVLISRQDDGLCQDANDGFETIFGHRREDLVGRRIRDVAAFVDPELRGDLMAELKERGTLSNREVPFRRRDGSVLHGSVSARPFLLRSVPHVISVTRDVTARKRAEEELVRSSREIHELNVGLERRVASRTAELSAANRELEAFVHTVAHDLRAPLRAIDGYSGIQEAEHAAELGTEGLAVLSLVRAATRRMDGMIRALIEYAEAGSAQLRRSWVDVGTMVRSAFDGVARPDAGRANEMEVGELPAAWADAALLRVALRAVLSNAIRSFPSGATRCIRVTGERDADRATYHVTGLGEGFDPARAEAHFGLFEVLRPGWDGEAPGVGLAVVRRIVERHGGRAWMEGTSGEGRRLSFSLPLPREEEPCRGSQIGEPLSVGPGTREPAVPWSGDRGR